MSVFLPIFLPRTPEFPFGRNCASWACANRSPWSSQSNSYLARDAGINDIGSGRSQDLARQDREQDDEQDREDNSRAGLFDSASNDDDHDSDGFDSDGDSDYA